jgi:hypothetical protein
MATAYKVLGQVNPAANTLTTAYTAAAQAVISTISVCNTGTSASYRIAVRVAGAAIDPKQYIVYNTVVDGSDSAFLTLGITMASTDVISVYATTSTLSFNVFGSEIS